MNYNYRIIRTAALFIWIILIYTGCNGDMFEVLVDDSEPYSEPVIETIRVPESGEEVYLWGYGR